MKTLKLPLCCFICLLLVCKARLQPPTRIIKTLSGPVQGTTVNFHGKSVDQYLGIPYAQPPLGKLRFRKPNPVKPWAIIRTADKVGPACIQYVEHSYPGYDNGSKSEDCLFLNIWGPHSSSNNNNDCRKIPVMFFIYGGGFTFGSNKIPVYNGLAIAAEGGVVIVTINYRLSSLGFFTTGTEEAPGNVALYDVLEALKWVNKNIGAFGGDPDQVTLAGQSSGALITGLFCVSPLTEGLFKRVIMESGSPALIVADNININLNKSQKIAEEVGCADEVTNVYDDPDEVVDCMRGKNALDIIKPVTKFPSVTSQSIYPNYGDDILPFNARIAVINGQFHNVDVLIGNTHDEGSSKLVKFNTTFFGQYGEKNPKINKSLGISLMKDIFKDIPFKDDIIQHYLGSLRNRDYDKVREQVYTAFGDFNILCPTKYFAESYSRCKNRVYYYFFVHRSSTSPWAKWLKVTHFEEVPFVFGSPLLHPKTYTRKEVIFSFRMIRIWSNFVKYGSPECPFQSKYLESTWPLYSKEIPIYVTLDADTKKDRKKYGQGPHGKNCDFFRPYFGFM